MFTFAFFLFLKVLTSFSPLLPPSLPPPPLPILQYSISFQVQSPISYLANTFSTSVKFIFCNFIGFPPVSQVEGKGSHYSLVLQPCPPPSTQAGEEEKKKKSSECRQLSLIFHQDAVFSGDSICVVNILKRFPRLPSPFLLPLFYLFIPPLSLSLSLSHQIQLVLFFKLLDS